MKKRMYEKKCRASFSKWKCVLTLIALAFLTYQTAWADDDFELGPLVQVSGNSPYPSTGCLYNIYDKKGLVTQVINDLLFPNPAVRPAFNSEVEPHIDCNSTDQNNCVVCWIQDRWPAGGRGLVCASTNNAGGSWNQMVPYGLSVCPGPDPDNIIAQGIFARDSDPWVSYFPNPNNGFLLSGAVFSDVTNPLDAPVTGGGSTGIPPPTSDFRTQAVLVTKSTDGDITRGITTLIDQGSDRVVNPHAPDKPSITVDSTNPDYAFEVWSDRGHPYWPFPDLVPPPYAQSEGVGTNDTPDRPLKFVGRISRTTDGGETWAPPKVLYDPGTCNGVFGLIVRVLPQDGSLVVIFNETVTGELVDGEFVESGSSCLQADNTQSREYLSVMRSTDKALTWVGEGGSPTKSIRVAQISSVNPIVVVDNGTRRSIRTAGVLPSFAVDPNNGSLYAVWQETSFSGGAYTSIAFSMSTDGGLTWTAPIQVNQTPDNIDTANSNAFLPSVVVAADGTVGVTYYDFRNNDLNTAGLMTDYWFAHCNSNCDKEDSWESGEARLTNNSFRIEVAPLGGFLGDYVGLATVGNDFLAAFAMSHGTDPASIFSRRVSKKEQ